MRLNSRAFLETAPNEQPHLQLDWLEGETDGLIALTGGPGGPLDTAIAAGQSHLASARCEQLAQLFHERLYIELQRHGTSAERASEAFLIDLAYTHGIPLVATNEPFFAQPEDDEAHDALICIAEGRLLAETDRRQLTPEHRFKTRAEMTVLFADLPEAVASTVERRSSTPRTASPSSRASSAISLRTRAAAGPSLPFMLRGSPTTISNAIRSRTTSSRRR